MKNYPACKVSNGLICFLCLFSEFIPYVFQILSLLIELHKDSVPDTYMALFPHLLTPLLWERPGNIPPLVRLLQAYMEKGAKQVEPERLVSFFLLAFLGKLMIFLSSDDKKNPEKLSRMQRVNLSLILYLSSYFVFVSSIYLITYTDENIVSDQYNKYEI